MSNIYDTIQLICVYCSKGKISIKESRKAKDLIFRHLCSCQHVYRFRCNGCGYMSVSSNKMHVLTCKAKCYVQRIEIPTDDAEILGQKITHMLTIYQQKLSEQQAIGNGNNHNINHNNIHIPLPVVNNLLSSHIQTTNNNISNDNDSAAAPQPNSPGPNDSNKNNPNKKKQGRPKKMSDVIASSHTHQQPQQIIPIDSLNATLASMTSIMQLLMSRLLSPLNNNNINNNNNVTMASVLPAIISSPASLLITTPSLVECSRVFQSNYKNNENNCNNGSAKRKLFEDGVNNNNNETSSTINTKMSESNDGNYTNHDILNSSDSSNNIAAAGEDLLLDITDKSTQQPPLNNVLVNTDDGQIKPFYCKNRLIDLIVNNHLKKQKTKHSTGTTGYTVLNNKSEPTEKYILTFKDENTYAKGGHAKIYELTRSKVTVVGQSSAVITSKPPLEQQLMIKIFKVIKPKNGFKKADDGIICCSYLMHREVAAYLHMTKLSETKQSCGRIEQFIREMGPCMTFFDLVNNQTSKAFKNRILVNPQNYLVFTKYAATFQRKFIQDNRILQNYIKDNKVDIMIQLLNGLKFIHSCGIFHGDIKEGNIFINIIEDKIQCYYGDFSSSRIINKSQNKNITYKIAVPLALDERNKKHYYYHGNNTYPYLAPELIKRNSIVATLTEKADIYSLGVTLCLIFQDSDIYPFNEDPTSIQYNGICDAIIEEVKASDKDNKLISDFTEAELLSVRATQLLKPIVPKYKNILLTTAANDTTSNIIFKCLAGMLALNPAKRWSIEKCMEQIEKSQK